MAGTEQEAIGQDDEAAFFADALKDEPVKETEKPAETKEEEPQGQPRDEHGRFRAAQEQEQPKGDEAARVEQPSPKEQPRPKEEDHRIPLRELLDERERRQKAEREAEELRRWRMDQERHQREAARPKREMPDVLQDPEAYATYLREEIGGRMPNVEQIIQSRLLNMSFADAEEQHGEAFRKAFGELETAVKSGDTRLRDQIVNAPNPGRALMRWHKERLTIREIGDDLDGYKTKLRNQLLEDPEFRKEAITRWRGEAQPAGNDRPTTVTALPSLNRATGSRVAEGPEGESEEAFFKSALRPRK